MITKVQKWGNSQGLRIARNLLEDAHIAVGDEVDLVVQEGSILVRPIGRVRGKYNLKTLLARIPKGYRAEEISMGKPVGKEVW